MDNENPVAVEAIGDREVTDEDYMDEIIDYIDDREIFDLIRHINDPEHPMTLEELKVVSEDFIEVNSKESSVNVYFTPTIPHCSMATLIGLCIKVRLLRALPNRFKVNVQVTAGSHLSGNEITKQLADKERIAAALENFHLIEIVDQCLAKTVVDI